MIITNENLSNLPEDLPIPLDDGASNHLQGLTVPPILLKSTTGQKVCLTEVSQSQRTVIYCYPMTGKPGNKLPDNWEQIPGARGCTPQSCAFRDHYSELLSLNVCVLGLSTQTTDDQQEAVSRLHLPFSLLSDSELLLTHALNLPTFEIGGIIFIKRLTMVIWQGKIIKVFYPVFPPDQNAQEVVTWLTNNP